MDTITKILGGLITLATLAGIFMLAWHGDIPGSAAVAVGVSAISTAGGAAAVHAGAKLGLSNSSALSVSPMLTSTVEPTVTPPPTS